MLNLSCHLQLPINTNKTDCHDITEILLLNSGKKIRASRNKKYKYSNSCVVRKKISERNKKT